MTVFWRYAMKPLALGNVVSGAVLVEVTGVGSLLYALIRASDYYTI